MEIELNIHSVTVAVKQGEQVVLLKDAEIDFIRNILQAQFVGLECFEKFAAMANLPTPDDVTIHMAMLRSLHIKFGGKLDDLAPGHETH